MKNIINLQQVNTENNIGFEKVGLGGPHHIPWLRRHWYNTNNRAGQGETLG